jgi:hypothetical protein
LNYGKAERKVALKSCKHVGQNEKKTCDFAHVVIVKLGDHSMIGIAGSWLTGRCIILERSFSVS